MGGRSIVLHLQQGYAADQVDGTGIDQFPAFHHRQRCLDVRRVHLGDSDVGHQAVPGHEEQRCDRQIRERRTVATAAKLSTTAVLADVAVLGVRAAQTARFQECEGGVVVSTFWIIYKRLGQCILGKGSMW
jgi:hypothetical protein